MQKMTCLILTLNSEKRLGKTLESVQFFDEILVVDSGSTDGTVALAVSMGARVVFNAWPGFGLQKQKGCELATHDWILNLDSDEVLSAKACEEIKSLMVSPEKLNKYSAFKLNYIHVFLGRELVRWSERMTTKLRLFDRKRASFDDVSVHEKLTTRGLVGYIPASICHTSYDDLNHYFIKFNRYTSLGAQEILKKGNRPFLPFVILRWPVKFISLYIFNGYFLCGWQGLVWSWLSACYGVVKYMKVYEMQESQKK